MGKRHKAPSTLHSLSDGMHMKREYPRSGHLKRKNLLLTLNP